MAKILLVEDDISLREIYAARLQAEGYDVVAASDGEEALAVAVKDKPDLVICDVMMPKISGFDVLDILRSTPETKHAKIVMMTALSQQSDRERGERLGADKYLVKSQVTLEDVVNTVSELLTQADAAADSMVANNVQSTKTASPAATSPAGDTNQKVLTKEDTTMDDNTTDNAAGAAPVPDDTSVAPSSPAPMPEPAPDSGGSTGTPRVVPDSSPMPVPPAPAGDTPMPSNLEVTEPDAPDEPAIPMPNEPPAIPPVPPPVTDGPVAPASNPQSPQPGETIMPSGDDKGAA